jgi:hypothetical protein
MTLVKARLWWLAMRRSAIPDGTRVRLICACYRCVASGNAETYVTSWTPRRQQDPTAPDDYELTRESDGNVSWATRAVIWPIEVAS